MKLGFSE